MRPVQAGREVEHIEALRRGRPLYLWGASIVGFGMCRALERVGLPVAGFIDHSPRLQAQPALGYPVLRPADLLGDAERLANSFVIVTSGHYDAEIEQECARAGLVPGVDVLSARCLVPIDPSVDVSGLCNLRCMSCPRGNFAEQPPGGFMTARTYEQVLDKLIAEIPLLGSVQLYAWGEPLLNPEIAAIIEHTRSRQVLCALSTNLAFRRDFAAAVAARPDWVKISTSGVGATYELTHSGGKWPRFRANLIRFAELKDRLHPSMYVEVNYHLYRHNMGQDYEEMARLCRELGFAFRPNWAYLYPLDHVMTYRQGGDLPVEARKTLDLLYLDIDEGLRLAEQEAHLECAEERCLPIAWDLRVRSCGAFFEPTVCDDFLATPLPEIRRRREESGICDRCKALALHRFTSVYVRETPAPSKGEPLPVPVGEGG